MATFVVDPGGTGDTLTISGALATIGDTITEDTIIECISSNGNGDSAAATISTYTNGYTLIIRAGDSHKALKTGIDNSRYRHVGQLGVGHDGDVVIDGLQCVLSDGGSYQRAINCDPADGSTVLIQNCYINNINMGDSDISCYGIRFLFASGETRTGVVKNCIVRGFYAPGLSTSNAGITASTTWGTGSRIYNCTVSDCNIGIESGSGFTPYEVTG